MPAQTKHNKPKKIKVGFDLDGVLFFNPLRFVRAPIELAKKYILNKNTMSFYVPKTRAEELMWRAVHMSSLRPATGWARIRELSEQGLIEPYLITARFRCLKNDFNRCLRTINAESYFAGCYQNLDDEQPHLFKEKMVKQLGIEYYVEDNWNIVSHLSQNTEAKVLWITNIFDASIPYEPRFPSLASAIKQLEKLIQR
jgi:hypothetical protein